MSSDVLYSDPRLGWIPYEDFSRRHMEKSEAKEILLQDGGLNPSPLEPPPPEFFIPPPPLPPSMGKGRDCATAAGDFTTCDSILTSSTLSDKDYTLLSGHLQSLSIILAVASIFVLAVCVTIFIIWRRRRSRSRLDYLWKDQNPIRPDHSHHPLIFDDGFESSGGGSSSGNGVSSNSNYRINRALPRNEFSNDTIHSNIFRIPDTESQIYEEVLDSSGRSAVSSDIVYTRNPSSSTSSSGVARNPQFFGTSTRLSHPPRDYSSDELSQHPNDLPLLSPTYSTPPGTAPNNTLPPLPSATLLRSNPPKKPGKAPNMFSTWLNRASSKKHQQQSPSHLLSDYRFFTGKHPGRQPERSCDRTMTSHHPGHRQQHYPSALQQPLILYSSSSSSSTSKRSNPPHIYTAPINMGGLMPNPDDILPKEAWTDFPPGEVIGQDDDVKDDKRKFISSTSNSSSDKLPSLLRQAPLMTSSSNNKQCCDNNSYNMNNNSNNMNSSRTHTHHSLSSESTCEESSDERFNSSSNTSSQGSVLR